MGERSDVKSPMLSFQRTNLIFLLAIADTQFDYCNGNRSKWHNGKIECDSAVVGLLFCFLFLFRDVKGYYYLLLIAIRYRWKCWIKMKRTVKKIYKLDFSTNKVGRKRLNMIVWGFKSFKKYGEKCAAIDRTGFWSRHWKRMMKKLNSSEMKR